MKRSRDKFKGRKENGSFVQLPHAVLNEPKLATRSAIATKLLVDLYSQYKGNNNGDLAIAWSLMNKRGWKSKGTLHKAKNELLNAGLIELTRQGGKHCCSLFAVTWLAIDDPNGKLDVPATRVASGKWKSAAPQSVPP